MMGNQQAVESRSQGVLMIWCNRPSTKLLPKERPEEMRRIATDYHYVCPFDFEQLAIRQLSEAKDPRVVLKPCPKCGTKWHGPTISYIRSRPPNGPRLQ